MDADKRILYVQMENSVRELDARLLLSLLAATANFQVLLAPKWFYSANRDLLPRGIYASKTLNKIDAEEMRQALELGHSPVAWDEEGPGQIVPANYLKSINDAAVQVCQKIYAWGDNQAAALATKFPDAVGKIEALGNPRWDLLRPEYSEYFAPEATRINKLHGRYILVNTNFSSYNAFRGTQHIIAVAHQTGAFDIKNAADQNMLKEIFAFEKENFERYLALIPALSAAFPGHTIIVRPHPTENHQPWQDLAAKHANVKTVYEGAVTPWLLAADAVVQNSCTTGVESLTMGKPVLSYCKTASPLQDWHLANEVCPRVSTQTQLIDQLRTFIGNATAFSAFYAAGKQKLGKHIAHLDGELSTSAIVKSLISFAEKRENAGAPFARALASQGVRPAEPNQYQRIKFPPLTAAEVADKAGRLARLKLGIPALEISQVYESCFVFRRAG